MKKMSIYEPAMCCSTGLCGVAVDPELLRISTVLNVLKNNSIEVERFNLSNSPQEFLINEEVNKFINTKGVDSLPVTILEGEIIIEGRYPTNEEFIKIFNIPRELLGNQTSGVKGRFKKSGGCGCSGGDCC
ncbi:arsenite efflux transporter metallochaperone ArsD [Clostridium sp. UBA4395]|uniref:arsenite efflux transporter metallochaperone ArsD n=1 Tax=Clostridium sp. UBA4395 TaxID=1946360 RepID=UPI00321756CC